MFCSGQRKSGKMTDVLKNFINSRVQGCVLWLGHCLRKWFAAQLESGKDMKLFFLNVGFESHSWLTASVCVCFFKGFKLKDFLRDNETLSHFLHHNASLPHHALKQIVEADVNLEKVEYRYFLSHASIDHHLYHIPAARIAPAPEQKQCSIIVCVWSFCLVLFTYGIITLPWPQCLCINPLTLAWQYLLGHRTPLWHS